MSVEITPEFKESLMAKIMEVLDAGRPPFSAVILMMDDRVIEVMTVADGLEGAFLSIRIDTKMNIHTVCDLSWVI